MTTIIAIVLTAAVAFCLGRWYGRAEGMRINLALPGKTRISRLEVTGGSVFLQPDTIVETLNHIGGVVQFHPPPTMTTSFVSGIVKPCPPNCPDCAANRGADAELDREVEHG